MTNEDVASRKRRILRLPEVIHMTGYKRSQIYLMINKGSFPNSIKLGARAIGFDSIAIEKWIDEKLSQNAQ